MLVWFDPGGVQRDPPLAPQLIMVCLYSLCMKLLSSQSRAQGSVSLSIGCICSVSGFSFHTVV